MSRPPPCTPAGQIIGTVAYMSPEQAAGDPDDIDTRSGVYALGVIGYEALSGKPPHDLAKRRAGRGTRSSNPTRLVWGRCIASCRAMWNDHRPGHGEGSRAAISVGGRVRGRHPQTPARRPHPRAAAQHDLPAESSRGGTGLVVGLAAVFVVLIAGIVGTSIGMQRAARSGAPGPAMNEYLRGMIAFLDPSVTKNSQVTLRNVLDDASKPWTANWRANPMWRRRSSSPSHAATATSRNTNSPPSTANARRIDDGTARARRSCVCIGVGTCRPGVLPREQAGRGGAGLSRCPHWRSIGLRWATPIPTRLATFATSSICLKSGQGRRHR